MNSFVRSRVKQNRTPFFIAWWFHSAAIDGFAGLNASAHFRPTNFIAHSSVKGVRS